jgi:hypothetical protein
MKRILFPILILLLSVQSNFGMFRAARNPLPFYSTKSAMFSTKIGMGQRFLTSQQTNTTSRSLRKYIPSKTIVFLSGGLCGIAFERIRIAKEIMKAQEAAEMQALADGLEGYLNKVKRNSPV